VEIVAIAHHAISRAITGALHARQYPDRPVSHRKSCPVGDAGQEFASGLPSMITVEPIGSPFRSKQAEHFGGLVETQ
jgi:hypothetical protein